MAIAIQAMYYGQMMVLTSSILMIAAWDPQYRIYGCYCWEMCDMVRQMGDVLAGYEDFHDFDGEGIATG